MLKPLQQFICDECGEIIEDLDSGFVEWIKDSESVYGFRIVHNTKASPYHTRTGCFKYTDYKGRSDIPLKHYMRLAHQELYALLDIGDALDPHNTFKTKVKDFREYIDFAKRITIPYYEEARLYLNEALSDGHLDPGTNVIALYKEDTLKNIVENYTDQ